MICLKRLIPSILNHERSEIAPRAELKRDNFGKKYYVTYGLWGPRFPGDPVITGSSLSRKQRKKYHAA